MVIVLGGTTRTLTVVPVFLFVTATMVPIGTRGCEPINSPGSGLPGTKPIGNGSRVENGAIAALPQWEHSPTSE